MMTYYENIIKKEHARRAREHAELIKRVARLEVKNSLLRQEVLKLQARIRELEDEQNKVGEGKLRPKQEGR